MTSPSGSGTELKAKIVGATVQLDIYQDGQSLGTLYLVPEQIFANRKGESRTCQDLKEAYSWIVDDPQGGKK